MEPILIIGTCKVQEGRLALHRPCQKRALVIKDLRHQRGEKSLKNPSSCGSWASASSCLSARRGSPDAAAPCARRGSPDPAAPSTEGLPPPPSPVNPAFSTTSHHAPPPFTQYAAD